MVWAWVLSHTVFKRSHKSTMIHWQTWDFQHSDQSNTLLCSSCCRGSQSGTVKVCALPNYWSAFPWNVRQNVFDSAVQTTSSTWPPVHARHNMARPRDNSLLTSLSDGQNYYIARTSEEDFKAFFFFFFKENSLLTLICCKERPHGLVTTGRSDASLKI